MASTLVQPTNPTAERTDFIVEHGTQSPGYNLIHRVGRRLWAPMFAMALMGFAVAVGLGIWRATLISDGNPTDADTITALGQFVPAAMFAGFAAVFAAVSFAIARILGEFRSGGGDVQATVGGDVQTLVMPTMAKAFLVGMMMAMMVLLVTVGFHIVIGVALAGGSTYATDHLGQWNAWLTIGHRVGVAVYLFAITLGLGTIVTVLRFQTVRIRELAGTN